LYFLLCNQWSLPNIKDKWHCLRTHYAISRMCSLQWKAPDLLCLHVKVSSLPSVLSSSLHCSLRPWSQPEAPCHGHEHTLLLTDLRPCQLRTNLEIRNRERRGREGKRKMPVSWTGFEKAPPSCHSCDIFLIQCRGTWVCLCCTVLSESKHTTVFLLCYPHRINSTVA